MRKIVDDCAAFVSPELRRRGIKLETRLPDAAPTTADTASIAGMSESTSGLSDSTVATTLWPPLTTIHQPVRALATEALQRLIQEIRGGVPAPNGQPRITVLEHQLIERDSTAPPRS